jgi:selenide,water dikinase
VQTVDYITPVLNDPYLFGQVAAANALSDIYAVGAKPSFALNLVGFPVRSLPLGYLSEILRGGADKAREAEVEIAGGHTIDDPGPKYGMVVTGFVHPERLIRKSGAKPGDVLFLTKPLGVGVLTTALDQRLASVDLENLVLPVMLQLNRGAARAMERIGVHACTDVTGFGLLGHLHEMATKSGLSASVRLPAVPILSAARHFAARAVSTGTQNNLRHLQRRVDWPENLAIEDRVLLSDAQTSGGLLIAVAEAKREALAAALQDEGCLAWSEIGHLEPGDVGRIQIRPE